MAVRSPALAKLTRPKHYDALARPRLFALLDDAVTRPIVWLCAPPGAGKSTLVASYLEQRGLRHLWYQVDAGDADPATFVHYMRLAAMPLARKKAGLSLFPPEPQPDLARFARGFFRDLFSALVTPCVLVLDNFHEARTSTEQRAALAQGLEEIPDGITLFVLSRTDPPPEFVRLVASRRIARVDETALRCTAQEAGAILGSQHLDPKDVERVRAQSDGWVAALVLLREHLSRAGAALDVSLGDGKDTIFQYFAGEIFNGAKPANQRMLMLTAIAPSITQAEAVALTGDEEAPRLLDYLFRRHLFVDRRRGAQTTYHYHALFRELLLEELEKRVPGDERRAGVARAAHLLAERGNVSDALALYRQAADWETMRTLIRANALDWARQGRSQALSDWIEALPADMRKTDPWLEYWFGRAWIFVRPERGRPALERAYETFRAGGDLRGQALALSTIVTGHYYEWADFRPLDRWLPEFERLLGGGQAALLDGESELRARATQLIALLFRRPEHAELKRCAQRLDELIDGESDPNVRVMAASILFNYLNWTGTCDAANGLAARTEPVVTGAEVGPLMQVWWRTHLSFWHYLNGRYDESTAVTAAALIERNTLAAPTAAGERWPFRLRVRVLGGFELIRDGQTMRFTGKAQQRPLDLIKLLAALGGDDVDSQQLTAALWPDADGAAAKTSFDTTLFRLRKLLDVDAALALSGGKLSLARSVAWVDVWALEAAFAVAEPGARAPVAAARRLLDTYRGPLLGSEAPAWVAKPRDALRARFIRALMRLGEELERRADWAGAIDLYRGGLEADNLAESLYRGLMRSLAASGNQAEALNVFRRCRELLSIVLGVKPSAETDRLHQRIAAAPPPLPNPSPSRGEGL